MIKEINIVSSIRTLMKFKSQDKDLLYKFIILEIIGILSISGSMIFFNYLGILLYDTIHIIFYCIVLVLAIFYYTWGILKHLLLEFSYRHLEEGIDI